MSTFGVEADMIFAAQMTTFDPQRTCVGDPIELSRSRRANQSVRRCRLGSQPNSVFQ